MSNLEQAASHMGILRRGLAAEGDSASTRDKGVKNCKISDPGCKEAREIGFHRIAKPRDLQADLDGDGAVKQNFRGRRIDFQRSWLPTREIYPRILARLRDFRQ